MAVPLCMASNPLLISYLRHRIINWPINQNIYIYIILYLYKYKEREDTSKGESERDKLINFERTRKVFLNNSGQLGPSLHSSEGTSLPHSSCNQLEGSSGNFLSYKINNINNLFIIFSFYCYYLFIIYYCIVRTCSGNTNDDGLSPSLVASLL